MLTAVPRARCLMRDDKQVRVNISLTSHFPAVCLELSVIISWLLLSVLFLFVILQKEQPSCNSSVPHALTVKAKKQNKTKDQHFRNGNSVCISHPSPPRMSFYEASQTAPPAKHGFKPACQLYTRSNSLWCWRGIGALQTGFERNRGRGRRTLR